ncbi:MAG: right-handed parallel beta-helix repeat-containing protein [Candidatus Eisenbacteria bacterium]
MGIALCLMLALAPSLDARAITFAGYRWGVKSGYWGPGPNLWSDTDESVWVDESGRLHLKIRQIDSTWYCAEVVSRAPATQGMFRFYMVGDLDSLDINAVASPFLYAGDSTEIDIEFSRWKDPGACRNAQYVIHPVTFPNKCLPSSSYEPFTMHLNGTSSTHSIDWQQDYVTFTSINGHYEEPPDPDSLIHERTFTRGENGDIPVETDSLRVHIDLWLMNGTPPNDGEEIEIVIAGADLSLSPPLTAPSNLIASDDLHSAVRVSWDWTGICGIGFRVFRDGSPVFTGSDIDQRFWDDTGVEPGISHTYYVAAYNATGAGPPSNTDSGVRLDAPRNWHITADGLGDAPTIQAGVDSAASGDTVTVACGVYHEHFVTIKSGIMLTSETADAACASIDADSLGVVILCNNVDSTTVIRGLTLTGGSHDSLGGAVYCSASFPSFENCAITDNHCETRGGGVVCEDFSAPTFTDCIFSDNSAGGDIGPSQSKGGGLYSFYSALTLINCTFSGNTAASGGAIYSRTANATLVGCTFETNSAREGGAVLSTLHGSIVVSACTFTGNSATLAGGGLCHWYTTGSATIIDSEFLANSAQAGGGMAAAGVCTLTVSGCTFTGNSATTGGAIAYECNTGTLEKTTMAFNTGGAALSCPAGGSPTLSCCDIYGNTGGDWIGCIANQEGIDGNFSSDPLFCDLESEDHHLLEGSPCSPSQQPTCGLIGACDVGCYALVPRNGNISVRGRLFLEVAPNPSQAECVISFDITGGAGRLPIDLKIYDVIGRHVRTILEGSHPAGRYAAGWDGMDPEGHTLPPGVYFCRLRAGDSALTHKLVRTK